MVEKIVIDPVTRVEGHGRISIHLDEHGFVRHAFFHVTQLRGFEALCLGRPFHEMPALMARICGICPVSHLVASAQACDAIMAVRIPATAERLRQVLNLAQIVQSHSLSFFYLSSPDLLLGMDADPGSRNLLGLAGVHPGIVREGIHMRRAGQEIIGLLGGKRVHPGWVVPGGVSAALSEAQRDEILGKLPPMLEIIQRTIDWFKDLFAGFEEEVASFANFPSLFLGLVDPQGRLEHYRGALRVIDSAGQQLAADQAPERYAEWIGETVEPWTFLKFPYFLPRGSEDGMYRVGPLARLNLVSSCGTKWADQELAEFRQLGRPTVLSTFHAHYARLIEILYCLERIEQILADDRILDSHVRAHAAANAHEGIGVSEAPRGTLIHHYQVDDNGLMTAANLIIATGHNNMAMNRGVLQAAKRFVKGDRLEEGMLNRVEAVIRAFDPCLSCSTHAVGQMPLRIELVDAQGVQVDSLTRPAE